MDKKIVAQSSFVLLVFSALLALSFRFDQHGLVFLVATPWRWLIWVGIAAATLTLLMGGGKLLSSSRLLAVGILYTLTPFACTFIHTQKVSFIILQGHLGLAVCIWAIAAIAFSLFFFKPKQIFSTPTSSE